MEGLNSSLLDLLFDNISNDTENIDNITIVFHESHRVKAYEFTSLDMTYAIGIIIITIFGTIGNILTFIIMRRGSLKDVSTCFYMSILALADTGE